MILRRKGNLMIETMITLASIVVTIISIIVTIISICDKSKK